MRRVLRRPLGADAHIGTEPDGNGGFRHVFPATKPALLAQHARAIGIPAQQVAAAGDSPSDIPMLRAARTSIYVGATLPAGFTPTWHLPQAPIDEIVRVILAPAIPDAAPARSSLRSASIPTQTSVESFCRRDPGADLIGPWYTKVAVEGDGLLPVGASPGGVACGVVRVAEAFVDACLRVQLPELAGKFQRSIVRAQRCEGTADGQHDLADPGPRLNHDGLLADLAGQLQCLVGTGGCLGRAALSQLVEAEIGQHAGLAYDVVRLLMQGQRFAYVPVRLSMTTFSPAPGISPTAGTPISSTPAASGRSSRVSAMRPGTSTATPTSTRSSSRRKGSPG